MVEDPQHLGCTGPSKYTIQLNKLNTIGDLPGKSYNKKKTLKGTLLELIATDQFENITEL